MHPVLILKANRYCWRRIREKEGYQHFNDEAKIHASSRFGWGFDQPGLVEGVPAHGRWVGSRWSSNASHSMTWLRSVFRMLCTYLWPLVCFYTQDCCLSTFKMVVWDLLFGFLEFPLAATPVPLLSTCTVAVLAEVCFCVHCMLFVLLFRNRILGELLTLILYQSADCFGCKWDMICLNPKNWIKKKKLNVAGS